MKRFFSVLLFLTAFGAYTFAAKSALKIGILLPASTGVWKDCAPFLRDRLTEKGFEVTIRIAGNNGRTQNAQMKELIEMNVKCIIVSPVETAAISESVELAQKRGIPILAYDRLLENTKGLTFYIGNNNSLVGRQLGNYIVEKFGLAANMSDQHTFEFFVGPQDDANARAVYDSLMKVLKPYIDRKQLVCRSGQMDFAAVSVPSLSGTAAKERCDEILSKYYNGTPLEICISTCDIFSYGIKESLLAAGYGPDKWPVITGVNGETDALRNIAGKTQTMTVLSDYRTKALACVNLVESLFHGVIAKLTDKGMPNGQYKVDAFLCDSVVVDSASIVPAVIDSGYIGRSEIGL